MVAPEYEAHGRKHRSLEFDVVGGDVSASDEVSLSYPTPDDDFDNETQKYVAIGGVAAILGTIGVVAAKRLHDKRKDS